MESSSRPTRAPSGVERDSSTDSEDEPRESALGRAPHPRRIAQTRHRCRRDQRGQVHRTQSDAAVTNVADLPAESRQDHGVCRLFHCADDRFQVLYVFLVLPHDRRRIVHFNVTAHPTAEWSAQQLREAFPFEQVPRYLLRDRDRIYDGDFSKDVRAMGITGILSAPRSPWQHAYVERVIGTIRRECLDHVIVLNEASLYRHVKSFLAYYHESRTHLSLAKDTPQPRPVHPPALGAVVAIPQVGGLHHRYERRAA